MALLEYIKDHLLFNDRVTLPGLGSFEINRSAARIDGNIIRPPTLYLVFNTESSIDDGSLAKNIATAEDISPDEATQKILEYIDGILFALNKGEDFVFEGLGRLFRDSENVLRFEKDPAYKIEFDTLGLQSFELDPVDELSGEGTSITPENIETKAGKKAQMPVAQKTSKTIPPKKKNVSETEVHAGMEGSAESVHGVSPPAENKNNRNIFWILTGAVMVILVSFILIRMTTDLLDGPGLSFFSSGQSQKSDLFPEDQDWDLESQLNGELGEVIDSMTAQENALILKETSEPGDNAGVETSEFKEFHIIAGSFKDKENAGVLQQSLTEQGYPALVIQQGDKLYRVSALSFKDKEKGLLELSRFRQKTKNNAAWLLELK